MLGISSPPALGGAATEIPIPHPWAALSRIITGLLGERLALAQTGMWNMEGGACNPVLDCNTDLCVLFRSCQSRDWLPRPQATMQLLHPGSLAQPHPLLQPGTSAPTTLSISQLGSSCSPTSLRTGDAAGPALRKSALGGRLWGPRWMIMGSRREFHPTSWLVFVFKELGGKGPLGFKLPILLSVEKCKKPGQHRAGAHRLHCGMCRDSPGASLLGRELCP